MIKKKELGEILELAMSLIRIPAFSTGPDTNHTGIRRCFHEIVSFLKKAGLRVFEFDKCGRTPALYADLGENTSPPLGDIMLAGHFDRVSPHKPDQKNPTIKGNWLMGRGAADMLTVVSTYLIFMKNLKIKKAIHPPRVGLLLVGNEEPGESEKWGTPHVLEELKKRFEYSPKLIIVGERTSSGEEKTGKIELKNRGVIRIELESSQEPGHTGLLHRQAAMNRMLSFITYTQKILPEPKDQEWQTTLTVSYVQAGQPGNFNTLPAEVKSGLEIRPIPEDDIKKMMDMLIVKAEELDITIGFINKEAGISVHSGNPLVQRLLQAAVSTFGGVLSDHIGKGKLPGTQARFAPTGCAAVVFGQTGKGPHSPDEAHFIPSIIPYYNVLMELACPSSERAQSG